MRATARACQQLGGWASLGLALHVGMVGYCKAAGVELVPRWALGRCVTIPPGARMTPERLAEQLAAIGVLEASPIGFRVVRGRPRRSAEAEAERRARISAARREAGRAGAAARWGHRRRLERLDRLPLDRPSPIHRHHAVCGRVCLPAELARELARKLGTPDAEAQIIARAKAHLDALGDGPIGGAANDYRYWRHVAHVEGWLGVPARRASRRREAPSAAVREAGREAWMCPHDPPCAHQVACAVVHAREIRTGRLERREGCESVSVPAALADLVEGMARSA